MPPDGSVGNCSWILYGQYGFFGVVLLKILGKYSDASTFDHTITLSEVAESDTPDWYATVFSFANGQRSLLAARNLRTGKIDVGTFAESKSLQSVSQPFTPFAWKNFAGSDFSWSQATPNVDVLFASLHARAFSVREAIEWLEAPHAIFDAPITRPLAFSGGGGAAFGKNIGIRVAQARHVRRIV